MELYVAASTGDVGAAKQCLEMGADANWACPGDKDFQDTPLLVASRHGHLATVKMLLRFQADVNKANAFSQSALFFTSTGGHVDVMQVLLDHGADVDSVDCNAETPLIGASRSGHLAAVKLLVQAGATTGIQNYCGKTARDFARELNHAAIVLALDGPRNSPSLAKELYDATCRASISTVRALLERGADVHWRDTHGETAIFVAAEIGQLEIAQLLLQYSPRGDLSKSRDMYRLDLDGSTPLHAACTNYSPKMAELLVAHGAAIDAGNHDGSTPLHVASSNGNADVVKFLIAHGASFDMTRQDGATPLHIASSKGYVDVVKALVDQGGAIDTATHAGLTPLDAAKLNGRDEVVKFLQNRQDSAIARKYNPPTEVTPTEVTASTPLPEVARSPQKLDEPSPFGNDTSVKPASANLSAAPSLFGDDMIYRLLLHPDTSHLVKSHEFVLLLLELHHNPGNIVDHITDDRILLAVQVLKQEVCPMVKVRETLGHDIMDILAANTDSCVFTEDDCMMSSLVAIKTCPMTVNSYLSIPNVNVALAVLFGAQTPDDSKLTHLVDQLKSEPTKAWPLGLDEFHICGSVVGESNHCIFNATDKSRPHDEFVVKLTHQGQELDFFRWVNMSQEITRDQVKELKRRIVKCEKMGEVVLMNHKCFAVVLEKGEENAFENLSVLKAKSGQRDDCLKDVLDAVHALHNVNYVHCDVKLQNLVRFGKDYKLVDFDSATRIGADLKKSCTKRYCPPEMAHFILGHTAELKATTKYDVWSTAVLVLELYSKSSTLVDFIDVDETKLLEKIASPGFSLEASLNDTTLSSDRKDQLRKCLQIDPSKRGTIQDLYQLLASYKTDNPFGAAVSHIVEAVFEATTVTVPTSFIILPYNIEAQRKRQDVPNQANPPEAMATFFQRLMCIGSKVVTAIQDQSPLAAAKAALDGLTQGEPVYFYLLDEVTGAPVEGDGYPIEITSASDEHKEFMASNIHLIQSGFKWLKTSNSVGSFFSVIGLPSLTSETMDAIEGFVQAPGSSVSDFDVVDAAVQDQGKVQFSRGPALRELEAFFKDNDPNRRFAGLTRVPHNGRAVWTKDAKMMKEAPAVNMQPQP